MNTENVKLWITALRSGEYTQTTGTLQKANGYCCLGVACRVAEKAGVPVKLSPEGRLLGSSMYEQSAVSVWLGIEAEDIAVDAVDKNDSRGQSFAEIADWLEGQL